MNLQLRHRCYTTCTEGILKYDPPRDHMTPGVAVIELNDDFAHQAREQFKQRHGYALHIPDYPFHLTVFQGLQDWTPAVQDLWGHLEGQRCQVWLTEELFWKHHFVWTNCYCPEYFLLRETLAGLPMNDNETWGHATIGYLPERVMFPRFLDYRDLEDWGFRP